MISKSKLKRLSACFLVALLAFSLCACSGQAANSGSAGEPETTPENKEIVRIGTMPTEDILPVWVAEDYGMFTENGLTVEVETFDSASALSAAIVSGQIDMAMTDTMRSVKLCESGCPVNLEWVTLGASNDQGRFGVMTSPESGITSLEDLVGSQKGIGVAANTVPEYVFNRLCAQAGIDPNDIETVEVASLPDRYTLMAEGQLDAAALPNSLLEVGEAAGMIVIADDTMGDNVSQSVMIARADFAEKNAAAIEKVAKAWDTAAAAINADPEGFRGILVQKASLNSSISETYPISSYPYALDDDGELLHPEASLVEPVIDWMHQKGYITQTFDYDASTGEIKIA